jgi:hypothetical protein
MAGPEASAYTLHDVRQGMLRVIAGGHSCRRQRARGCMAGSDPAEQHQTSIQPGVASIR